MAWTTPRTWVTDELVTAALMNSHVRDNLNAVPHLVVRKTADQSVTSSTTLVNDSSLVLALAASEVWYVRLVVLFTAIPTTGDIKAVFTMPTSCNVAMMAAGVNESGTADFMTMNGTASPTTQQEFLGLGSGGSNDVRIVPIEGVVANSSTAGNFQLQWAQRASSATATVVKANSMLWAVKLA